MIVWSSVGQSAAGRTITGAVSIIVPGAIGSRAKMPRPRPGLVRISMRWLGTGRMRPHAAASRKILGPTRSRGLHGFGRLAGMVHDAGGLRRRSLCHAGRRHLGRRSRSFGFVLLFLHSGLERLDPLREIAHHAGQLPGTEQYEDDG